MSDLWFAATRRDEFGACPAWHPATSQEAAERIAARADFGTAFAIDARLIDPPVGVVEAMANESPGETARRIVRAAYRAAFPDLILPPEEAA